MTDAAVRTAFAAASDRIPRMAAERSVHYHTVMMGGERGRSIAAGARPMAASARPPSSRSACWRRRGGGRSPGPPAADASTSGFSVEGAAAYTTTTRVTIGDRG